jgi:hypothetical protein
MAVQDLFHSVPDGPGWIGAFGTITQFGGPDDPEDSGGTASGFSTLAHPDYPYVALPIPVRKKYNLRWGMAVVLQFGGVTVCGFLADKGPSASLMRIADVSPVLMRALGGHGLLENVRIVFRP